MAVSRTKSYLQNSVFQDNQAPGSITAGDVRDFVESVPDWIISSGGWHFLYDNTTTINLVDGVPQKLTLSNTPLEDSRYPANFAGVWDNVNDKLTPALLNGSGTIRISFQGTYTGGTAPHIDLFIDVGSDPIAPAGSGTSSNIIYADSPNFAKSTGEPQWFNFVVPLFVGPDFAANGGHIIIQSHGNNVDISNIAITGLRIFNPSPGA